MYYVVYIKKKKFNNTLLPQALNISQEDGKQIEILQLTPLSVAVSHTSQTTFM